MRPMIFSDLVTMKNSAAQLVLIMIVVGGFIIFASGTVAAGVAAVAVALPFMYLMSISAYDEMKGWERFRLTFPLTRKDVARGRYASMVIVAVFSCVLAMAIGVAYAFAASALTGILPIAESTAFSQETFQQILVSAYAAFIIVMLASTIGLPSIMRYGVTKGTRMIPVIVVIVMALAIMVLGSTSADQVIESWLMNARSELIFAMAAAAMMVVAALFLASAAISARLYERREF